MRVLVFLLILGNLLFLAWSQGYLGSSSNPDALRVQHQLLADQVRIVARDEPPPLAEKSEKDAKKPEKLPVADVEKKTVENCLQLTDVPVVDVERVEALLAGKFSDLKATRTETKEASSSYWVFIPPLASKKDAENKVAELKKLQVDDYYIVNESGTNNHAVSLGLFSTREAAESYLETLKGKKVKSAQITEKNGKPALATLEVRGPETFFDTLRKALSDALPDSTPVTCKAVPTAPAQ